ncbi:MAG: sumo domain-containing protein, partial [Promethearchaeia archaeon]
MPLWQVSVLNKWQFSRQMHNGIGEWQARKQFAQDRRRLSALASIHEDAAATFENDKDRTEVENASSTLGADSIEAILMSSDSSDNRVCLDSEKEANTGPDKNQQVHSDDEPTTIRVKGLDDTIMNLQVSPNIAIGIALKHYATISELDYSKLEFSFHNMLLRSQQTPHLLGMRDGDVIVCQLGPDRNLLRKPAPGIGAMPAVPADEVSLSAFDLPLPRADLTAAASEEEITRTTVQQVNGETNRVHVLGQDPFCPLATTKPDVADVAQVADSLVSVSAARNMPWSQKQAAANQDSTGPEMCVEEESATEPVQVSMEEAGAKPVDGSSGALSQNADTGTSGTSIPVPRAGELTGDCAGEDMAESRINGQDSAMSSNWQANAAEQPPTSSNAQARHAGNATSRHAVTHAMEHTLDKIQSEDRDSLGRLRLETVKRLMDR